MANIVHSPIGKSKHVTLEYNKSVKLSQIVSDLNLKGKNLAVFINDEFPEKITLDHVIHSSDVLRIYEAPCGGESDSAKFGRTLLTVAVIVAASAVTAGLGGGVGAKLVGAGILVGGNVLISRLAQGPSIAANEDSEDRAAVSQFSISASKNAARLYQPLPIVMGSHRMFPDFGSQPYTRYEASGSTNAINSYWGPVANGTKYTMVASQENTFVTIVVDGVGYSCRLSNFSPNGFSVNSRWLYQNPNNGSGAISSPRNVDSIKELYDSRLISEAEITPLYVYFPSNAPAPLANKWVIRELVEFYGTNVPVSAIKNDGEEAQLFEYTQANSTIGIQEQVLYQIMNYGFGDINISNTLIGTTPSTDFREISFYDTDKFLTNWEIEDANAYNWQSQGVHGDFEFNTVEGDVNTAQGGKLVNNNQFSYQNNFIVRESPTNTFAIEVDVSGRVFDQEGDNPPGGIQAIFRYIRLEFREAGTSDPWETFEDVSTLPLLFTDQTLAFEIRGFYFDNLFQATFSITGLDPNKYEVRVAKVSEDETEAGSVCDLSADQIKFYQTDKNTNNYIAQNRRGIRAHASSQLNGALDTISSDVEAKTYNLATQTWELTSNPADWFLYFARGGFVNNESDGSFNYPFSPTIGWQNNADHPDNKERLFGAGVSDSKIDFDSILEWRNYCETNNLFFNAVLATKQNCFETLQRIATVGRASVTWSSGKLGVVYESADDVAVAMFGMNNIIRDSFNVSYSSQDKVDEVVVQYTDSRFDWEQREVRALVPGVTKPTNITTVSFWGIAGGAEAQEQAQREANLLAAAQLYNRRTISWECDIEGLMVRRGDVVLLSHDVTQWSWSGQPISATIVDGWVEKIKISCDIDATATYLTIRRPNGSMDTQRGEVVGDEFVFEKGFSAAEFAYYYDQIGSENTLSNYPNSVSEDFMFFADVTPTPGKKVRILNISMVNENRFKITAIDEDLAYYGYEYNGLPDPITPGTEVDYERLTAKVYGIKFVDQGDGKAKVYWESDGALGATAFISVNNSVSIPYIGPNGATIFGDELSLEYTPGDTVTITVTPVAVGQPYQLISDTVEFTLE